jgi:hypothetical protein
MTAIRLLGLLLMAVIGGPTVVACTADSCWRDAVPTAARSVTASLNGPAVDGPGSGPATGACPMQVEIDKTAYWDTRGTGGIEQDAWTLADDDLTPIGHASRATLTTPPFRDDKVFAIRGIDPSEAVAMRAASPEDQIVVLVSRTYPFPDSLCPLYPGGPLDQFPCHAVSPGSSGSGRTGSRTGP